MLLFVFNHCGVIISYQNKLNLRPKKTKTGCQHCEGGEKSRVKYKAKASQ